MISNRHDPCQNAAIVRARNSQATSNCRPLRCMRSFEEARHEKTHNQANGPSQTQRRARLRSNASLSGRKQVRDQPFNRPIMARASIKTRKSTPANSHLQVVKKLQPMTLLVNDGIIRARGAINVVPHSATHIFLLVIVPGYRNAVRELAFETFVALSKEIVQISDCLGDRTHDERVGVFTSAPLWMISAQVNAADGSPKCGDRIWNRAYFSFNAADLILDLPIDTGHDFAAMSKHIILGAKALHENRQNCRESLDTFVND